MQGNNALAPGSVRHASASGINSLRHLGLLSKKNTRTVGALISKVNRIVE